MAKRPTDPFSLSDEEIIDEIYGMDQKGLSADDIVERLEIKYGSSRVGRYDLVSALIHLIHERDLSM